MTLPTRIQSVNGRSRLLARIADLEGDLAAMRSQIARILGHTTVDRGSLSFTGSSRTVYREGSEVQLVDGSVREYGTGDDPQLLQQIGRQYDGTHTVAQFNGPTPPAPSAPVAAGRVGALSVSWDGTWVDALVAPMDLARLDVHITSDPEVDPMTVPPAASVMPASWSRQSLPVEPGTWLVYLVAWTTSGKYAASAPSAPVVVEAIETGSDGIPPAESPTPDVYGGPDAIAVRLPQVENADQTFVRVYVSPSSPVDVSGEPVTVLINAGSTVINALADGTPLTAGQTYHVRTVAFDADGDAPPSGEGSGVPVTVDYDQAVADLAEAVTAADAKAADAQADAQAAIDAAIDAASSAANAQSTADAKGKVIIQSPAPATADRLPQNLWIDTTGGLNLAKRWSGSAWVAVQDKGIQDAAAAAAAAKTTADQAVLDASQAQSTADGKSQVRYGPAITTGSPPTLSTTRDGDLYFGRDGTAVTQQWRRVGTSWVSEKINGAVLTSLDAGSITTGFLDVATRIAAGAITTPKLAAEAVTAEKVAADVMISNEMFARDRVTVGNVQIDATEGVLGTDPDTGEVMTRIDPVTGRIYAVDGEFSGSITGGAISIAEGYGGADGADFAAGFPPGWERESYQSNGGTVNRVTTWTGGPENAGYMRLQGTRESQGDTPNIVIARAGLPQINSWLAMAWRWTGTAAPTKAEFEAALLLRNDGPAEDMSRWPMIPRIDMSNGVVTVYEGTGVTDVYNTDPFSADTWRVLVVDLVGSVMTYAVLDMNLNPLGPERTIRLGSSPKEGRLTWRIWSGGTGTPGASGANQNLEIGIFQNNARRTGMYVEPTGSARIGDLTAEHLQILNWPSGADDAVPKKYVDGGSSLWINNSGFLVPSSGDNHRATGWSLANGDSDIVVWENTNRRFVVLRAGTYTIGFSGSFAGTANSVFYEYRIDLNGNRRLALYGQNDVSSRGGTISLRLNAGDIIEPNYRNGDTSGSRALRGSSFNTISFARVSP